ELELLKRLDRIFTDCPVYGSRRLQVALLREGISVGRRRVRRLMRKLGLWALRPKRNTSKRHPGHKVYPYLLRGKTIDQPNQSLPSRKRGARNSPATSLPRCCGITGSRSAWMDAGAATITSSSSACGGP